RTPDGLLRAPLPVERVEDVSGVRDPLLHLGVDEAVDDAVAVVVGLDVAAAARSRIDLLQIAGALVEELVRADVTERGAVAVAVRGPCEAALVDVGADRRVARVDGRARVRDRMRRRGPAVVREGA